jgi:hypothetical protein
VLVLATPKLAGPTIRVPWRRQMPSSSARSAPVSPEVITTSALTPRRSQSSATPATSRVGTAIIARSTCSGSAAADGMHGTPSSSAAPGLTTYTGPGKPPEMMFRNTIRPVDPGRRPAPMTAAEAGTSTGRRLARSADRSRSATA